MSKAHQIIVNGRACSITSDGARPLLDVLRNELGLMATRFGCGTEGCGACMVLVDGAPVYACTLAIDALAGCHVVTLEGIGTRDAPHPLQQAFLDEQAGQCGYCLSGIIISAKALLDRNGSPSRAEIAAVLDKHLCRCGAHARIIKAVERAVAAVRTSVVEAP
jgi:nicotinate dehydrogenase subunit A